MKNSFVWRSRWAAIGAAVAVSLGGGGFFLANAAPGPNESTIVNVTPTRVLDTRDPINVGLPGPFTSPASQKLQITGSVPTTTGTQVVVPVGATGVLLNVTAVSPTAAGFISIRPGDATGEPATSSLNVRPGVDVPNAVQVTLPTAGANAGKIDITYNAANASGPTTEILVDVVGYTTNTGLQELVADVALKANAADVYTRAQADSAAVRRQVVSGYVSTTGTPEGSAAFTSSNTGVGLYSVSFNATGLGLPAAVFPMAMVASPSSACPGGGASADWSSYGSSGGLATSITLNVRTTTAAGALSDCGFSFHATFQGSTNLGAPADAAPADLADVSVPDITCYNEPTGVVCE